ncbi:MAG: SUMF1/EgtB/PvdO family nonheme iron enzyme [Chloroflexi bacterium]|nr:SUMF1/EgtB/PvdO family nonheme iron enzyme [Chloroflexota bacterium]
MGKTLGMSRETRGLWTDQPILGAKHDRLNFTHYADVLSEVVLTADTPITIGIFGPWGSGKTSLMRLVAERLLTRRSATHRWARVVWFNAWQYERDQGALWRALLLRVLEGLENDQLSENDAQQIKDWRTRLYTDVQRSEAGSVKIDWPKLGKGALSLGLSLVPSPGTFLEVAQLLQGETGTLEDIITAFERERTEVYRRQLTLLEEFQGGFAHLVREYVWSRNGLLIIVIDDLDRCLPDRAVEVLEAIKLFLDVQGCVFFVGVDRDVIERVVRVQYADYMEDGNEKSGMPIAGQSYLEKIVQLPFHLPPLEDDQIAGFISQHDSQLPLGCRDILALGLEPNPRVVKRTLNIFRLLLKLAERRVADGTMESVMPELLAKMVVIQARYHDLYHDLLEYPNLIQDLELAAREGTEVERAVSPLLKESPETGTLLERYLRYKPLLRMLRVDPTFADLTRSQINAYIYLTRTTSDDAGPASEMETARLWRDLLSNDITRVRAAVDAVRAEGGTSAFAKNIVDALVRMLESETKANSLERISAGTALAYLGDPRSLDEMVDVSGGEFQHGERRKPTYVVAYRIGRFPVTNAQYARFLADNSAYPVPYLDQVWAEPYNWHPQHRTYPEGKANHPVVLVSQKDALAYCEWAGMRLPTEVEWEKAARGEDGRTFPWGNEFNTERANVRESGVGSTTPVGVYPDGVSPYGLFECAGNVWEWTTERTSGDQIVICGGSWNFYAQDARCFARDQSHPGYRSNRIGFRVATGTRSGADGNELQVKS